MNSIKLLLLSTFILISLSNHAQTLVGDKIDLDKILENTRLFSEHVMASDYQKIGDSYTADAKIFPSNVDIIKGRENIIRYWTPTNGSRIKYHKVNPEEIKITGDEAFDYGYYEGITLRADGTENSWKGKYVIVWRKVENDWKIYLDIWNGIID